MLTARSVALADWRDAHLKVDSRANDLEVSPSIRGFLPLRRADRARARSARLVALQQGRDDVRRAIDERRFQSARRHDDVVPAEHRPHAIRGHFRIQELRPRQHVRTLRQSHCPRVGAPPHDLTLEHTYRQYPGLVRDRPATFQRKSCNCANDLRNRASTETAHHISLRFAPADSLCEEAISTKHSAPPRTVCTFRASPGRSGGRWLSTAVPLVREV